MELLNIYPDGAERPFASRVLFKAEKGYSVIHKKALAIYWGMKKFSQYFMGRRFILALDHKLLLYSAKKNAFQSWPQIDFNEWTPYSCLISITKCDM